MLNNAVIIGLIIIWVYVLSVLKRAKTDAFYFLAGSAGLFVILLLWSKPYGVWLFSTILTWSAGVVGHLTGLFDTFYAHMLFRWWRIIIPAFYWLIMNVQALLKQRHFGD
ncbi:hypothetical protein [Leuconostoc citreum]|uniref:hypothetical protein n=1 Tax=Leuconostoc citreum TaxID=33964 RepID=UPI001FABA957|nr:hypothetical protein [Leuconostoc citreum]